jgi:outer membrane protein assembly factor BamB
MTFLRRRRGYRALAISLVLSAAFLTSGCEVPDWFGTPEAPPLPGERISVLRLDQTLSPDPSIADVTVRLPKPWRNDAWPQSGGSANHALHHLEGSENPQPQWRISIGTGSNDELRLLASPVIAFGLVYTFDARARVSAFDVNTGALVWRRNLTPETEEAGALGGGVAIADGLLYASTGYGYVYALDAGTGKDVWQQRIGSPIRGAPTAIAGKVIAITYDNRLFTLSSQDGEVLWSHTGLPEEAGIIGSPSAAVEGDVVLAPYSSGELVALRLDNGRVIWSDQLIRSNRVAPLSSLSEIRGHPVIDRDLVVAISHSGRIVAIELRSGRRVWDRDIGGLETPWVAGDFIFLVTSQSELICLTRRSGRIKWVVQLPAFENEKEREDPITWNGPVLVSDRLILTASNSQAVTISPYTGELLGRIKLPDGSFIPPVVAGGTIYILTDKAELIAYR